MRHTFILSLILAFGISSAKAQNPERFADELAAHVVAEPIEHDGDLIIFTGSSSIRMWAGLKEAFPGYNVVNHGFGGSEMSDLQRYLYDLVIKHKPMAVFVYEGDNDIAAGEKPAKIFKEAGQLVSSIRDSLPEVPICFISPKPSVARWEMRMEYSLLNMKLANYSSDEDGIYFIDVWDPMLNVDGSLNESLFIDDGLHMNEEGYAIWREAILPVLEDVARK